MTEKPRRRLLKYLIFTQLFIFFFIIIHAILWYVFDIKVITKLCPFAFGNHLIQYEFNFAVLFWILIYISTLFVGRAFCAWGCMFGAIQDFIYRFKRNAKIKSTSNRITNWILILIGFIIVAASLIKGNNESWPKILWFLILVSGIGIILWLWLERNNRKQNKTVLLPKYIWFSQYVGGIIFSWLTLNVFSRGITLAFDRVGVFENVKLMDELLIVFLVAAAIIGIERRVFCKYICPIGMILRLTSSIPFFKKYRVRKTENECTRCKICTKECPMDVGLMEEIERYGEMRNAECINCLACVAKCPKEALEFSHK